MITAVLIVFIDLFVFAMNGLIIARVIASWFTDDAWWYRILRDVTDPILDPIRKLVPTTGGIDFAPMIAWALLTTVQIGVRLLLMRVL